jgi:hypothetical protein
MMFQIKTVFLYVAASALLMPALSHAAGIKVIAKGVVPNEEPEQIDQRQEQEAAKHNKSKKIKAQKKKAAPKTAKNMRTTAPISMIAVFSKPVAVSTPVTSKKKDLPVAISPTTAAYERSSINFNGLINRAGERQSRLVKRVKLKTADKPEEGTPSLTDFDDLALKKREKPDYETAKSTPRAPDSIPAPVTVSMRNKKN